MSKRKCPLIFWYFEDLETELPWPLVVPQASELCSALLPLLLPARSICAPPGNYLYFAWRVGVVGGAGDVNCLAKQSISLDVD